MNSTMIRSLNTLGQADLPAAGGKGANLGELIRAGIPVPDGFVITTDAYQYFVEHHALDEHITTALNDEDTAGAAIRQAFERADFPAEIEADILNAWRAHGGGAVAVRSSATAEDLPHAAFAGQQDTYLNITTPDQLLDAVRRCWASLWTDRAIAYRRKQGIDHTSVKLAVVVQYMIPADTAGVMFTANPISGERVEVVIDATVGLGEALVSGLVTPDHYRVNKRTHKLIEATPGRRESVIRAQPGGGTIETHFSTSGNELVLTQDALAKLSRLGVRIEAHFERPMDIEWTILNDEVSIVQARPLTALPASFIKPNPLSRRISKIAGEIFWTRPYPLDVDTWLQAVVSGVLGPMVGMIGLHLTLESLFNIEDGIVLNFRNDATLHASPSMLLAPFRIMFNTMRYDPAAFEHDPQLQKARRRAFEIEQMDFAALPVNELNRLVHELIDLSFAIAGQTRKRYMPGAVLHLGLLALVLRVMGEQAQLNALLSGVDNATLQANRALQALAMRIRNNSELTRLFAVHETSQIMLALQASPAGQNWLTLLQDFMDQYGHREATLATVYLPTWKDAPEIVLGLIKSIAPLPAVQEVSPAWEDARDGILKNPLMRVGLLRRVFLRALSGARNFGTLRENSHYDFARTQPGFRRIFMALGSRLVDAGVLTSVDDIFHLRYPEALRAAQHMSLSSEAVDALRETIHRRAARRASLSNQPVVDPRIFKRSPATTDALLHGSPGSPGIAKGPVKIIHDMNEFDRLNAGDVLVAPFTNPAWTPLFQRAIAVIVDTGGSASHAAIVAREYGIPAVMGVIDGTRLLSDGQYVQVDGSQGVVLNAIA